MPNEVSRRSFLQSSSLAGAGLAALTPLSAVKKTYQQGTSPWPICFNTSSIRPATLEQKIEATVAAGYDGIEPWIDELEEYEKAGGNLQDLGKRLSDLGLFVPNVIGLWGSIPADPAQWEESLAPTRNRMRMMAAIGSRHAACIPPGRPADVDRTWCARCYRDLVKIGREEYGISAALEFVGFMESIHRFGDAAGIAIDANIPDACLIMDTFHLYRGGSGFEGIRHIRGNFIANFHINDVPSEPAREEMVDKHRIYPGDGILPLASVFQQLKEIDYRGALSIEMFNEEHYAQEPKVVAETALRKTLAVIEGSGV
ncbi:MAG TPA: sugar phosphate isomerase/epimerase [Candidatus Hydrogenedentes bacterium]|jgi:sugar phosphate isomerase/epimerase|nr:sugar phosphate isomerase/epimerase [Candidatus Hydrogenedentota bacterium]